MIGNQARWQEDLFVAAPLSSLVPDDHILKRVDSVLGGRKGVRSIFCVGREVAESEGTT